MKCSSCNKEVPDGSKFCNHCGHKFEQENIIKCTNPDCGHMIPSDSKFCPDCGLPVDGNAEQEQGQGDETTNCHVFTINGVSFKMVRVEHGEFMMGATPEQTDPCDDEIPVHNVILTHDYFIGETLVTQALWRAVMNDNPSRRLSINRQWKYGHPDDLPIDNVSWDDCQKFISKLNKYTGKCFRLPTEAEWEFAARGGKQSQRFHYAGSNEIEEIAWYGEDSNDGQTHPVKKLKPNELGIYDMIGNVSEWCQDWYDTYDSCEQTNPTGPTNGEFRVLRGGSYSDPKSYLGLSRRDSHYPDYNDFYFGVRLCLTL